MHRVPILMADIKGSSKVPAEKLMKQFRALVGKVNTNRKENIKSPLTITLGDEFQGVIDTFENGIKIIS